MKKRGTHYLSNKGFILGMRAYTPFARIPSLLRKSIFLFSFVSFNCDDVIISLGYFFFFKTVIVNGLVMFCYAWILNEKGDFFFYLESLELTFS